MTTDTTADEQYREPGAALDRMLPVDLDGVLDLDRMRQQAPLVRQGLIDHLRAQATVARAHRGTVVVPEDTYDLVRRLTAAGEVLRMWRDAFDGAAREADALTEEEAVTVAGAEMDGVLTSSLFVPDGEGQRIAVRADYKAGESTWDVPSLVGWLIDDSVETAAAGINRDDELVEWSAEDARQVAREVVDRLLALGRFSPSAREVEALRKKLAERGRDSEAAIVRQVRSVGPRRYQGVKITREEAK